MTGNENVVQRLLRERQEQQTAAKTAGGCLKALGVMLSLVALVWWRPFVVMLSLGILHSHYSVVPALGFWATWAVVMAWSFLTNRFDFTKLLPGDKQKQEQKQ